MGSDTQIRATSIINKYSWLLDQNLMFCWKYCKRLWFCRGIGDHVFVRFLGESGFGEKRAKNGESLTKQAKNGCFIVLRNHHKTSERDSEKCRDRTQNAIAW